MKKQLGGILLALALLLTLAPALGGSARAKDATGVKIAGDTAHFNPSTNTFTGGWSSLSTSGSHQLMNGNGTILYANFASAGAGPVLLLKNFKSAGQAGVAEGSSTITYGIYADGDLTIAILGNNELHSTLSNSTLYGIYVNGNLTITNGTDTNNSNNNYASLDINMSGTAASAAAGIYCTGKLTIKNNEGGSVTVRVNGSPVTAGASYGIYAAGSSYKAGEVNVTSGELTATGGSAAQGSSYGLSTNNLTISGGTVNANGGNAAKSRGAYPSNFTMSGGTLNANGGAATGTNGTYSSPKGSAGLELGAGTGGFTISFTGGVINASGGSVPNGAVDDNGSYGVWPNSTAASGLFLTTGGTVVAKGYTRAARYPGRLTAPKLLCDTAYSGSNKKVSAADTDAKYAELRTDQVGVAVTGWDYGTYNETKNGPFYCAAAGVTVAYTGRGGTTYNSATRPNNAGDYTVTAKYNGMTASANFTISRRDLSKANVVIDWGTQPTYNGDAQGVRVNSVTCDGNRMVSGTDYTITSGGTATNVGYTNLTLTGKGNYTGTCLEYWSLRKATPTTADFTIPAIAAQSYTGYAVTALPAPTLKSGRTGCGSVTVKYNGSVTRPTDAGTYTVTFDVAGGDNYNAATGLAYGTLTVVENQTIDEGTVDGTKLSWRLTQDGTLTISGTGAIPDYSKAGGTAPDIDARPWNVKWKNVTSLVVTSGVTRIGDRAFQGYTNLTSATIADSVTSIGESAFNTCTSLSDVTMGKNVTLGKNSFCSTPAEPYILERESDAYTASGYFNALCGVTLTGDYRNDVIAIALSQKGYHEGNSEADYGGGNADGQGEYTEYGRYLTSVGNAWCSEFATWCVRMAGVPANLLANSRGANATTFTSNTSAQYHDWSETTWGGGSYTPQKGDLILWYFKTDGNFSAATYKKKDLSHTSIIESVTNNGDGTLTFRVVHGNVSNSVRESSYNVNAATGVCPGKGCVGYFVAPDYGGRKTTHTVTFNANGGTVSVSKKTVADGGLYGVLPIPTSERGDTFLGWYTAAKGGSRVNMYTPVSLGANQTLYAHWGKVAEAQIAHASVSGVTLTYSVTNVPENARLIVAWYDANGKMLGMTSVAVGKGSTTNAKLTVGAGGAVYKLMLVDKTTFAPLCEAEVAARGST